MITHLESKYFLMDTFSKEILVVKQMRCQRRKSLCSKKANVLINFEKIVYYSGK